MSTGYLSFDEMAGQYDETRNYDEGCFSSALDYLVSRFPPDRFPSVLEPGIGTGRIAIPLAERGYQVTGVDVSKKMLAVLDRQIKQMSQPLPISFYQADVQVLPFLDESFSLAMVVHLFYFIRDWQRAVREIIRVVRKDSPLVMMHTGTGAEIPSLNQRYKELCAEAGSPTQEVGVNSNTVVVDYLSSLGYRAEWVKDRWQWSTRISLDRAVSFIESRSYSFTRFVPDNVHLSVVKKLAKELRQKFGSLEAEIEVPNQIYLVMIQK
ncbi:MAG: class I SAM-dependent methyltransferase [Dehalococcoidales bacterium]|nr:class I SAM-dependent methyltransferase [Dehalococcoidales bacterium]